MKELFIAWAILHGADVATTIRNHQAGLPEGNPLAPRNPVAFVALTTAETAFAMWSVHKLEPSHPKLARGLAITVIGAKGVTVGWNLRAHFDLPH